MKKVLFVFGTRPEAIKLAPVIYCFKKSGLYDIVTCSTGQHQELMNGIFDMYGITLDHNLQVLNSGDSLNTLFVKIAKELEQLVVSAKPDLIIVHGDTVSTLVGSLTAFLNRIPLAHVEAGLRTFDKNQPWPEESNRSVVGVLADYHFAPTIRAANNLLEAKATNIFTVGNTVVDSVKFADNYLKNKSQLMVEYANLFPYLNTQKKLILVTLHRRENYGNGFVDVCMAIKEIAKEKEVVIIFPVHFNPNVRNIVLDMLSGIENIHLVAPLAYLEFIYLMSKATLIITDSGGIQEEAPYFKVPILVCRNTTERPEVVESGLAKLVGTEKEVIVSEVSRLLNENEYYKLFQKNDSPFGNGNTSEKILEIIKQIFFEKLQ